MSVVARREHEEKMLKKIEDKKLKELDEALKFRAKFPNKELYLKVMREEEMKKKMRQTSLYDKFHE